MHSSALLTQPSQGLYTTNRKCYELNNKGRCLLPNCRYLHKCLKCNNLHPAINCGVQVKNQNNIGQNVSSAARQGTNFRSYTRTNGGSITNKQQDLGRQLPNLGHKEIGKTPIKTHVLLKFLKDYPKTIDKNILVNGFINGFYVGYEGPRLPTNCNNSVSAYKYDAQKKNL